MRCTPVRCTPLRYIPMSYTPVRYTLIMYTPIRYTPMRCKPMRYSSPCIRGARSKGDQQPDGRVAHNQKLLNILGVDTRTLATRVLRARKTRK
jgi:hypothetical protein